MSNTELLFSPSFSQSISGKSRSHKSLISALTSKRGRTVLVSSSSSGIVARIFGTRTGWLWWNCNGFPGSSQADQRVSPPQPLVPTLLDAPLHVADPGCFSRSKISSNRFRHLCTWTCESPWQGCATVCRAMLLHQRSRDVTLANSSK